MRHFICVLAVILITNLGYSAEVFREVPSSESKITWVYDNGQSKNRYLPETAGAGVAIFDYNNDGWMDLLFVNSGSSSFYNPATPQHPVLYRNNGDGTYTDVSQQAGLTADLYGQGVAVGDYDGDGYEDIFITGFGKCVLYHNNGNGTFTDVTAASGIAAPKWGTSALWFDYDNDGKLDLFVGEFADYSDLRICNAATSYGGSSDELPKEQAFYCYPKLFPPVASHLYRNLGNGRFADVSASTGIASSPGKVWGVVATDINQDGYMDLFASNDTMPNFLWVNREGKKFDEVGLEAGIGYSADGLARSGMGVDAGDFDNDGLPDLLVTNVDGQNTSLYKNLGGETFQELNLQTGLASVTRMLSGWGLRFIDYDNDGWLDIIAVNGHPDDSVDLLHRGVTYKEPIVLLRNIAGTKLQNVSGSEGPAFSRGYAARGLAVGDLNNDGYPDIVFTVLDGPPCILVNNATAGNNWLGLQLKAKKSNPAATGAIIRWSRGGKTFSRVKNAGGGFLSSSDPREILGVGKTQIDWVEVQWPAPSHAVDRIEKPAMNRYLQLVEGEHPVPVPKQSSTFPSPHARVLRVSALQMNDVETQWQQAKAAMAHGDFTQARQILLRAVKANPRDPALWFHLGVSCSQLNDDDQAIAAFERARALSPRRPDTYFDLGLLYWRTGDLGKAKEAYRAGLALDPTASSALQNYSLLLMKTGGYEDAIAPLLRLKKDAKLTLAARVGLIECYLKTAQPSKANTESDELIRSGIAAPADQTKLAAIFLEQNAPQMAEKLLKNSLSLDPNQANAQNALGTIYLAHRKLDDAFIPLGRAVQLDPDSSEYALAFDRVLLVRKQYQVALPFLKSVEPKFGKLPDFQFALAVAYFGANQFQDAANILENLVLSNPRRQDRVYFLLGDSYFNLGTYDRAEQAYRKAIEINPKDSNYYWALATLMRKEGPDKLDEAIVQLKLAHQYNPDDPQISLQLALCYESKQQLADAAALLEKVVQQAPDLSPAHVALTRIYFRLGKKTEGEREKAAVKALQDKDQQKVRPNPAPQSVLDDQP